MCTKSQIFTETKNLEGLAKNVESQLGSKSDVWRKSGNPARQQSYNAYPYWSFHLEIRILLKKLKENTIILQLLLK